MAVTKIRDARGKPCLRRSEGLKPSTCAPVAHTLETPKATRRSRAAPQTNGGSRSTSIWRGIERSRSNSFQWTGLVRRHRCHDSDGAAHRYAPTKITSMKAIITGEPDKRHIPTSYRRAAKPRDANALLARLTQWIQQDDRDAHALRHGYSFGRAPAARSANCRSHADNSNPARCAASSSARFCSVVTRIRTTSTFRILARRLLGVFFIDYNVAHL
jgi:hypothetical protein